MEVRIGVQDVAREVVLESSQTADEIAQAVASALGEGGTLRLKDDKGREVIIPGRSIGYVDIGVAEVRQVGFTLA
ncbi:uncharacterized protein DUF3107 [Kineococcus xinjiangensis]|uniref:Uncharacterized protein DUF3107 n=1 Tax=Kineococcus xinjiangensis TaxID=512762 RepID=A0A2S6IWP5_9ACTN|nr:DUF3107 domain-containing protein [Kineococcus xinjiangensis]PPK98768.1 uncharacterized protein DUF3107 [Kineococcus xinjiangensis]